jgi:hypothetical protein
MKTKSMEMRIGTMELRITANLLILALALVAFAGTTTRAQAITAKPNVVVVFVDALGWTDLGVYGSKFYETPRIDELAKQGAILKQHEIRDIVAFLATIGPKTTSGTRCRTGSKSCAPSWQGSRRTRRMTAVFTRTIQLNLEYYKYMKVKYL